MIGHLVLAITAMFLNGISKQMWILGAFAVYAPTLHTARLAYEQARSHSSSAPFGTLQLETGEEIDWVDLRSGVIRQSSLS